MKARVKSMGGEGGIRCECCGKSGRSRRPNCKRAIKAWVRARRRKVKRAAIQEGVNEV